MFSVNSDEDVLGALKIGADTLYIDNENMIPRVNLAGND